MNYPQIIASYILDLIFPVKCIFCGKYGSYACKKCLGSIPIKKSFECIGCARPVNLGLTCFTCRKRYSIDQLLVVSDYKDPKARQIIKAFKYRFIKKMSGPIYGLAGRYMHWLSKKYPDSFKTNPLLVPVPLTRYRLNYRGFNQSELIASELSKDKDLEIMTGIIERLESKPQADLKSREERKTNLDGKFRYIGQDLGRRDVILVDDVCTTGAPLNEYAKLLKQNGAGKIAALVIARG